MKIKGVLKQPGEDAKDSSDKKNLRKHFLLVHSVDELFASLYKSLTSRTDYGTPADVARTHLDNLASAGRRGQTKLGQYGTRLVTREGAAKEKAAEAVLGVVLWSLSGNVPPSKFENPQFKQFVAPLLSAGAAAPARGEALPLSRRTLNRKMDLLGEAYLRDLRDGRIGTLTLKSAMARARAGVRRSAVPPGHDPRGRACAGQRPDGRLHGADPQEVPARSFHRRGVDGPARGRAQARHRPLRCDAHHAVQDPGHDRVGRR